MSTLAVVGQLLIKGKQKILLSFKRTESKSLISCAIIVKDSMYSFSFKQFSDCQNSATSSGQNLYGGSHAYHHIIYYCEYSLSSSVIG